MADLGILLLILLHKASSEKLDLVLSHDHSGLFFDLPKRGEPATQQSESPQGSHTEEQSKTASSTRQDYFFTPVERTSLLTSISARMGDMIARDRIPSSVLKRSLDAEHLFPGVSSPELELSGHLVTRSISSDRPLLQVLFHVSSLTTNQRPTSGRAGNQSHQSESGFCATAYAHRDTSRKAGSCALTNRKTACLVEIDLPASWWNQNKEENVHVFFSATELETTPGKFWHCGGQSRSDWMKSASYDFSSVNDDEAVDVVARIKDTTDDYDDSATGVGGAREEASATDDVRFVATVGLVNSQVTYTELQEDQNVLVYVPQGNFHPGSRFKISVKLQVQSDLKIFSIRIKTRCLMILGTELVDPSKWRISQQIDSSLTQAMATVAHKDGVTNSSKDGRMEHVFDWLMEVSEDVVDREAGKIQGVVRYELNSKDKAKYRSVENTISSRVDIQRDSVYAIVPVVKTSELLNLAVVTGRKQTYPLKIYSVSYNGRFSDVTSQTTCHSSDNDVMKVTESCTHVYLDGNETKGSPSSTIITKFGRHTKFLSFLVWKPDIPLRVVLSDSNLGQVKGWKTYRHSALKSGKASRTVTIEKKKRRRKRDTDFGILESSVFGGGEEEDLEEQISGTSHGLPSYSFQPHVSTCEPRFQSTVVDVYASFSIPDDSPIGSRPLVKRHVQFRITDHVLERIQLSDNSVAVLDKNIIEGIVPGTTKVQVVSKHGATLGSTELHVTPEKVSLEDLKIDVISGLVIQVSSHLDMERTIMARITKYSMLKRKYQEALMDITLNFDDGTSLPLHYIPEQDVSLTMDVLDDQVIAIKHAHPFYSPRLLVLGHGKGDLVKVNLESSDWCLRKKPRPLAVGYAYVDADLTTQTDLDQDETSYSLDMKRRPLPTNRSTANVEKGVLHINLSYDGLSFGNSDFKKEGRNKEIAPFARRNQGVVAVGGHQNQLTPLEIGMYTLLAVFCVAVVVFGVNCAVFMAKHRGKGVASASSPRKTTYTHSSRKSSKLGVALLIGGKKRSEGSETVDGNVIGGAASAAAANCSPDWVWIGREILERNAIETACSKALMPDEEFQNAAVNKTSTGPIVATGTSGDPQAPLSSSSATTTATTNLASADNSPSPLVNSSVCRGDFNQTLPPQYHQVLQGCYDLDKTAATFAEGEDDDVDDDDDNDDDEDDDDEQDDNGMEGSQINNKGNEDCSCEILTAREKGHSAVTEKSKVVHRATRLTNHSYKHPKISTNRGSRYQGTSPDGTNHHSTSQTCSGHPTITKATSVNGSNPGKFVPPLADGFTDGVRQPKGVKSPRMLRNPYDSRRKRTHVVPEASFEPPPAIRQAKGEGLGYCNSGSSDVEWDYAALGVPPDELSEYFDNLKESIA